VIVITTPTGSIGSQVVDNLIAKGEKLRVIARYPEKLSPQVRQDAEIIQGSSDDIDVLLAALDGADALYWCVPPAFRALDTRQYYRNFVTPVCQAIRDTRLKQVVGVSALGRGAALKAGPISNAHFADAMIEETGVSYRALWNPGFMENLLRQAEVIRQKGMFFLPNRADLKAPVVAVRDIAAVATRLLLDRSWTGQGGVPVLGPEDLSYNDMAEIMSEVLSRPVWYQQIDFADFKNNLVRTGASEAFAQDLVDMRQAINNGLYNIEPRTVEGTTPTTFRSWCLEVLKPTVYPEDNATPS
jgi:uncharacterized protein YbjT (DUF2867 family)